MTYKSTYDYSDCVSAWLSGTFTSGSTAQGRMSFNKNILYSYNAQIAEYDSDTNILIINANYLGYGVTTTKHINTASKRNYNRIYYEYFDDQGPAYYHTRIKELTNKFIRARKLKPMYKQLAKQAYQEMMDFMDYTKIDKRTKQYRQHIEIFTMLFKNKLTGE